MAVVAYQPHVFAYHPTFRLALFATKRFLVTVVVFTLDRFQETLEMFRF